MGGGPQRERGGSLGNSMSFIPPPRLFCNRRIVYSFCLLCSIPINNHTKYFCQIPNNATLIIFVQPLHAHTFSFLMGTKVLGGFWCWLQQKTAIEFNKVELRFEFHQWVRAVDVPHSGSCLVLTLRIFLTVADLR